MASPDLYLVVPVSAEDAAHLPACLTAVLSTVPAASVLLTPKAGERLEARLIKPAVEAIQAAGAAALLADDAELVRIVRADGLHLTWAKEQPGRYALAREDLGARYSIGADAGRSRHDAMTLCEAGADYVAFGIPPHVEDRETAFSRQLDLISWWAEIFQPPCVALDVAGAGSARALAGAGADFVALTLAQHRDPQAALEEAGAFYAALTRDRAET